MDKCVEIGGKTLVSSRRAAADTGYTQDYVGQLARAGEIEARRLAGRWYVDLDSVKKHKEAADEYQPQPPAAPTQLQTTTHPESVVMFDGREYVSTGRAAALTGYTQDYVGQLAREAHIPSRQVGNRWYIAKGELLKHKRESDAQLAAVQADATGYTEGKALQDAARRTQTKPSQTFSYTSEDRHDLMPRTRVEKESAVPIHRISDSRDTVHVSRNNISRIAEIADDVEDARILQEHHHSHRSKQEHFGAQQRSGSITTVFVGILVPIVLLGAVAVAYFVVFSQGILDYQRSQTL